MALVDGDDEILSQIKIILENIECSFLPIIGPPVLLHLLQQHWVNIALGFLKILISIHEEQSSSGIIIIIITRGWIKLRSHVYL